MFLERQKAREAAGILKIFWLIKQSAMCMLNFKRQQPVRVL